MTIETFYRILFLMCIIYDKRIVLSLIHELQKHENQNNDKDILDLVFPAPEPISNVYWIIKNPPLRYGANIQLECKFPINDTNYQNVLSWRKGINDEIEIITDDTASINTSKYKIWKGEQGYLLEIGNFGPKDANIIYTCDSGFNSYGQNLTLDEHSFERRPSEQDISSSYEINGDDSVVTININNVFPKPKCDALSSIENDTFINSTFKQNATSYNVTFKIRCTKCRSSVIHCKLKTETLRVFEYHFLGTEKGVYSDQIISSRLEIIHKAYIVTVQFADLSVQPTCNATNDGDTINTEMTNQTTITVRNITGGKLELNCLIGSGLNRILSLNLPTFIQDDTYSTEDDIETATDHNSLDHSIKGIGALPLAVVVVIAFVIFWWNGKRKRTNKQMEQTHKTNREHIGRNQSTKCLTTDTDLEKELFI